VGPQTWQFVRPEHVQHILVKSKNYPFGVGQRTCLGKHFALLEGALVLAEVGRRYQPRLVPGQEIKPYWSGTLRPDKDVMMVLEERGGLERGDD